MAQSAKRLMFIRVVKCKDEKPLNYIYIFKTITTTMQ